MSGHSESSNDRLIGTTIMNQYKILSRIGAGGMGAVYVADQVNIGRQAAVKVLHQQAIKEDPTMIERFKREAKAAVQLDHESIVNVYNFGELDDGTFFLAMELVEGYPLTKKVQEAPLDPEWSARLVMQIADGLSVAHKDRIIHRDLKPDNILITERRGEPLPKILDFGVAKLQDDVDLTKTGLIYGTPKYMSPEQIRGEKLDGRSDMYSLGCIFYSMLTGEAPVKSQRPIGYIIAHQNQIPPRPNDLNPNLNIPKPLEDIVMRMLEKDRNARFADMEALVYALKAAIASDADDATASLAVGSASLVAQAASTPRAAERAHRAHTAASADADGDPAGGISTGMIIGVIAAIIALVVVLYFVLK